MNKALVDEDEMLRLIDQMRVSMPREIKQAQQIQQEREQILSQAQEKAEATLSLAREQADRMVDEHELRARAEQERQAILEKARKEADAIRAQADDYALEVLEDLAQKLESFQKTVRNGIDLLNHRATKETEEPKEPLPDAASDAQS